jgi:hypothetical protein
MEYRKICHNGQSDEYSMHSRMLDCIFSLPATLVLNTRITATLPNMCKFIYLKKCKCAKVVLMAFKRNRVVGLDKLKIDASLKIFYSYTKVCLKHNELYMTVWKMQIRIHINQDASTGFNFPLLLNFRLRKRRGHFHLYEAIGTNRKKSAFTKVVQEFIVMLIQVLDVYLNTQ